MGNARNYRSRGGFSGNRRKTSWSAGPGGTAVTSVVGSSTQLLGSTVTPTEVGLTIARIRGNLKMHLLSATAAGDGFQGAFGIGVATAAAVAIGVTAVPTPLTEQGSENWLYWAAIGAHQSEAASVAAAVDLVIDSKAMRKFPGEMALYAMTELVEIGTATMSTFFDSRVLFFLP